jgi:formylmethanofuran dehydrogenase subunit E
MSKYCYISGKIEIYDFEKFKYWLFEELQKQDLVGVFDINIKEASKCVCEKCGEICQENDLYEDINPVYLCENCFKREKYDV